jgi:hypothetical protein
MWTYNKESKCCVIAKFLKSISMTFWKYITWSYWVFDQIFGSSKPTIKFNFSLITLGNIGSLPYI